jgi:hypothetical protein
MGGMVVMGFLTMQAVSEFPRNLFGQQGHFKIKSNAGGEIHLLLVRLGFIA